MAVSDTGKEALSDEVRPLIGVDASAGETEGGLARESDASCLSAAHAAVLHEAHLFGITAVQHFLDGFVVERCVKAGMRSLELRPVILKDFRSKGGCAGDPFWDHFIQVSRS